MSDRKIIVKNGYMKFLRLGPIEFGEQSRWDRAPAKRGMWAFPYPFFDMFFAYHKYSDLMPKSLKDGTYEEKEEWINTHGRRILPIREFWYKGDVFSHFYPNGQIGDTGIFYSEDVTWTRTDVSKLAKFITQTGADRYRYRDDRGAVQVAKSSVDHLEVFITPQSGQFRHGANPSR